MTLTKNIRQHFTAVLNAHAQEGVDLFSSAHGAIPVLSHACFKFQSMESYRAYRDAVASLGSITAQAFGGKEISWCHLHAPWVSGQLQLAWLELVEPKLEPHLCDAISSIGYAVPGLPQVVKILSKDESVVFRYQASHAGDLAGVV